MSTGGNIDQYAETLREEGVVVIDEYLEPEKCESIKGEIEALLERDELTIFDGGEKTYQELSGMGEPVVNKRSGGRDDGMLDIFNVDLSIPAVDTVKNDDMICEVISRSEGTEYGPQNINVYVNKSVTNTRGYHADSYSGQFKSFVYLTEVPDEAYGPFSYVKGTHKKSRIVRNLSMIINKLRGDLPTDALFYDDESIEKFTAPKGTLIISNQSGYHRGIPQSQGKERMVLTTNYAPE